MRNSSMGLCIALVVALLIGCAHPHRHHSKKKVVKPHVSAVWIPGRQGTGILDIGKNKGKQADTQKQEVKKGNWLQIDKWKLEGCYRFTVPSLHNILQKRLHDSQVQHLPFQV
ncbi:MAG: hypothetical protein GY775_18800 [Candidatus Scalindua sp.]|nr:hypothetical protein [Candidatus Scalindua sp.]